MTDITQADIAKLKEAAGGVDVYKTEIESLRGRRSQFIKIG